MEHFSDIEWINYVRSVADAAQRAPLQEHLDEGCGDCQRMVTTWAALVEFAHCEASYEPPSFAVRNAQAYFVSFGMALRETAGVRILQNVFDSFYLVAFNGIRGTGTVPRQLMYNAHSVFIDLRIEPNPGSSSTALIGQVVDTQMSDGILDQIPVSLLDKGETALHTTTDQFGEFKFSFTTTGTLGLLLKMKHAAVFLVLPEGVAGSCTN